jgi:hypothetical protein
MQSDVLFQMRLLPTESTTLIRPTWPTYVDMCSENDICHQPKHIRRIGTLNTTKRQVIIDSIHGKEISFLTLVVCLENGNLLTC